MPMVAGLLVLIGELKKNFNFAMQEKVQKDANGCFLSLETVSEYA